MANLTLQVVYLWPCHVVHLGKKEIRKIIILVKCQTKFEQCLLHLPNLYVFKGSQAKTLSLGTVTYVVVVSLLQAWFHQTGDSVSWVLACDNQIASADDSPWNEYFVISRTTSYVPNLVQRQLCSCMEQRGWMLTSEHWTIDCEVFSDWIWSKVWRDNIKIIVSSSCHDFSLIWSRVALWQDPSTNSVILIVSVVLIMQLAKPTNICL